MKNIWQVDLEEALERLAEVEAVRDRLYTENQEWRTVANGQAARLAAVEALCEEDGRREPMFRGWLETHKVRAAARGQGDRSADCGHAPNDPGCVLDERGSCLSGEGDRPAEVCTRCGSKDGPAGWHYCTSDGTRLTQRACGEGDRG